MQVKELRKILITLEDDKDIFVSMASSQERKVIIKEVMLGIIGREGDLILQIRV